MPRSLRPILLTAFVLTAGAAHAQSHDRVGPSYLYPNSATTPGMANPDITEDNIAQTICNPKWSTKAGSGCSTVDAKEGGGGNSD